jgi:hypothetical protein
MVEKEPSNPGKFRLSTSPRQCLCCRTPFQSQGAHNRLCDNCSKVSVSPYAL